jgi:hypothetical protein
MLRSGARRASSPILDIDAPGLRPKSVFSRHHTSTAFNFSRQAKGGILCPLQSLRIRFGM